MLQAGYVHLDLHSDNILLSASGMEDDLIIDHEFGATFPDQKLEEVAAFVFGYLYRCQVREHFPFEPYRSLVFEAMPPFLVNHPIHARFFHPVSSTQQPLESPSVKGILT